MTVALALFAPWLGGGPISAAAGDMQFRINSLLSTGSKVVDHIAITGDDRGGIAASASHVFYSGDSSTARFFLGDLSGGTALAQVFNALVSDLGNGEVYSLGNGTTPLAGAGTATTLVKHDGTTGALTTDTIPLSSSIVLPYGSGIFAGHGRILLHTGSRVYAILLPAGTVQDLGAMSAPTHVGTENWAYWGVAEYFGGTNYLVYVKNNTTIARTAVPSGMTTTLATFVNLSDMACITVSIPLNRWYFHHEYSSQFGGSSETIGYADATFFVQPADNLSITPASGLTLSGFQGRPFSSTSLVYTLVNVGVSNLDWAALYPSNWTAVVPDSGTLAPGGTNLATVSVTASINDFMPGTYAAPILFSNATSGAVNPRPVTVSVFSTNLVLNLSASGYEGQVFTNGGQVVIGGPAASNLTVTLSSLDLTEVLVPTTVVIPVGQTSVYFNVTLASDGNTDGVQTGVVIASAVGLGNGTASVVVKDVDLDRFVFAPIASPQAYGVPFVVQVAAVDVNGATIGVYQASVPLSGVGNGGPATMQPASISNFVNGVWTGIVTVLSFDTNVRLTVSAGGHSGTSDIFNVIGPRISVSPTSMQNVSLAENTTLSRLLAISNAGNASLAWFLDMTGVSFANDVESGTNAWTHNGTLDLWHISTHRSASGTHAWYCGKEGSWVYTNSMNCSLISPSRSAERKFFALDRGRAAAGARGIEFVRRHDRFARKRLSVASLCALECGTFLSYGLRGLRGFLLVVGGGDGNKTPYPRIPRNP